MHLIVHLMLLILHSSELLQMLIGNRGLSVVVRDLLPIEAGVFTVGTSNIPIIKQSNYLILTKKQFNHSFTFFLCQFEVILNLPINIRRRIKRSYIKLSCRLFILPLISCFLSFLKNFVDDLFKVVLELCFAGYFSFELGPRCLIRFLDRINHFLQLINHSVVSEYLFFFSFSLLCWLINQ